MQEYLCPRCEKVVMIIEVNSRHFKYKIVCPNCIYVDWVDVVTLKEKQENARKSEMV